MKIEWIVPILATIILSACGPSESAVNTAIAQTQAVPQTASAQTEAAETSVALTEQAQKIPLDEINLEELLILPGDLPTAFEGQQIRTELPKTLRELGVSEGINTASQAFRNSEWASEGVTITVYKTADEAERIFFDQLNNDLPSVDGLGDNSIVNKGGTLCDGCSVQIIFIRCNALAYIDIFDQLASSDDVYDTITTYAKRLDERLIPLVCEQ